MQFRLVTAVATSLAALSVLQCHEPATPVPHTGSVLAEVSAPVAAPASTHRKVDVLDMAEHDPFRFLIYCKNRYAKRNVQDYTCLFTSQQRVGNEMTPIQESRVRFRENPYSVDMTWTKNATAAERALYVKSAWKDGRGRELAWFKPAGAIIKLLVPKIKQRVDGVRAKAASRRTLNQFGFRRTLDLIIKYAKLGQDNGDLKLAYVGEGAIDNRPTYVFERRLPFNGHEQPYPDRLLRYHIDQKWLVPIACFSYADRGGNDLLGSYVFSDVRFNVGLDDDDFDPQKNGF